MSCCLLTFLPINYGLLLAAEPVAESKPSVKKLDGTRYQIGEVTFDEKTREIRFPTKLNLVNGLLEYLVVHQKGKVHESLLTTEISPTHLNLAFILLKYKRSPELYPLPNETGGASDIFPEVTADVKASSRVNIDIEWTQDGKTQRLPVNECIQHSVKTTAMPAGPWLYGGSDFSDGQYVPEICGDVIAIFLAPSALLHYPGEDRSDDNVWIPFPKRIPAEGTNVTVIITPFQTTNSLPQP
jgi:hypothetical protein